MANAFLFLSLFLSIHDTKSRFGRNNKSALAIVEEAEDVKNCFLIHIYLSTASLNLTSFLVTKKCILGPVKEMCSSGSI